MFINKELINISLFIFIKKINFYKIKLFTNLFNINLYFIIYLKVDVRKLYYVPAYNIKTYKYTL